MRSFHERMVYAALLRADVYEEVEADRGATWQAFAVVVMFALAAGLGSFENGGLAGMGWVAVSVLGGWWIWAYLTYWIGTRLLPGPETVADHGELLRTIGFSSSPGLLCAFGVVPGVAGPIFLISGVWLLVAMVIAVRQALDYSGTGRAIAVCALGFPIFAVIVAITLIAVGPWPV